MSFPSILLILIRFLLCIICLIIYYPLWLTQKGLKYIISMRWEGKPNLMFAYSQAWVHGIAYLLAWVIKWPTQLFKSLFSILLPKIKPINLRKNY